MLVVGFTNAGNLTPLEYKKTINYVPINGNCRRKIVEETTKSADAPNKIKEKYKNRCSSYP